MEKELLGAAIGSRDAFEAVDALMDPDRDLSEIPRILWIIIQEYYYRDQDAEACSRGLISDTITRKYPRHVEVLEKVLQDLPHSCVSVPNIVAELVSLRKLRLAREIATAMDRGDENKADRLVEEYVRLEEDGLDSDSADVYTVANIDKALDGQERENLIKLYPQVLNDRVSGGVPRGTHIGLAAVPEGGKSLFALNLTAMWVRDGLKVLYVNNEESASSMLMRIISRLSGKTKLEVLKDRPAAVAVAESRGLDNLVFAALSPGTFREVQDLIDKHDPDCLVLDQISQMSIKGVDGDTEQLARASKEARRLGKKYGLVVLSVTQANDSARNKRLPDMGDIYMSRTSFPGAVDLLIILGADEMMMERNERMLSLPKNKTGGDHSPCHVLIEPSLTKMTSSGG